MVNRIRSKPSPGPVDDRSVAVLVAYYVTLALYLIFAFIPEYRVWAFNWWAYYPLWTKLILVGIGAAAPIVLKRLFGPVSDASPDGPADSRRFVLISAGVILVSTCVFYLLRAQVHFLGDGYLQLSLLAEGRSTGRFWDIVGGALRSGLFAMTSGTNAERALTTYQWSSYVSGFLSLIVFAGIAYSLYTDLTRRLLVFAALLTGGYALLFFGYVENYSPLMLLIAITLWLIVLAAAGRVAWWWALLAAVVAAMWHIFAVTLIVAPLYLGLRTVADSSRSQKRLERAHRWLPYAVLGLGIVATFALANWSLFIQYALVPIIANRVTADGYTFFSPRHLVDLLNMAFVLVPGLLVALMALRGARVVKARGADLPFILSLILIPSWLIIAVFDPNLGMARDWDIFAFAGLPTVLLLSIMLLDRHRHFALALASVLAALVLYPRAVAQTQPETAIAHFRSWAELDPQKSKSGRYVLVKYYNENGDPDRALVEEAEWRKDYPSFDIEHQAEQLYNEGQYQSARGMSMRAIKLDPRSVAAYTIMARSCMATGDVSTAYTNISIANAINPNSAATLHIMGGVECAMGETEQGLEKMRRARQIEDSAGDKSSDIAQISLAKGDLAAVTHELELLAVNPTALPYLFIDLTESLMRNDQVAMAQGTLAQAIRRGADSAAIASLKERYVQLRSVN